MKSVSKKLWLGVGVMGAIFFAVFLFFYVYQHGSLKEKTVPHSPSSLIFSYRDKIQSWKKNIEETNSVKSTGVIIEQEMLTVRVPYEFLDEHVKVVNGFHRLNNLSAQSEAIAADYLTILDALLSVVTMYKV